MPANLRAATAILALLLTPGFAHAHTGGGVQPQELWNSWNPDPWVLITLGSATWLYARGVARLWARAGSGRGIARWRFGCYCAAVCILLIALATPLDALGGSLFSAHMLQHEMLIVAAAPLLALGTPMIAFAWALPPRGQQAFARFARRSDVRSAWRSLTHPISAWLLHAVAIWAWHLPALYQGTLGSDAVHALQHSSFFLTALLFWWTVLRPGIRGRAAYALGVIFLFTTALYGSALGALLTFASTPWYPMYNGRTLAWGLTVIEDQQLGGLIMWIPFGALYTAAAVAMLAALLRSLERRPAAEPIALESGGAA